MFESKHYVPGIKWRQGLALSELNDAQRDLMTPLVDIPPIPWNFEDEEPAKSIDQHLTKVPAQMADYWGTEHPLFVDLALLDDDERMANGRHPVDDLFARLNDAGVEAIPVTGTDRDANYQAAVRTVLARDDQGVALRLTPEDFGNVERLSAQVSTGFARGRVRSLAKKKPADDTGDGEQGNDPKGLPQADSAPLGERE